MLKIRSFGVVALALLAIATTHSAYAQSTPARGETKTITGCLRRDAKDAKDFNILGQDGIVWDLEGQDKAKFEQHVGHMVTLSGKVEDVDRTSKSAEANGGQTKAEFDVSQITMISDSCQQTSSAAPSAPLVAQNTPPPSTPQTPVAAQTPPSQTYSTPTPAPETTEELPRTASSLPLVGLFGCMLLGAAFALRKLVRV